MTKIFGPYGKPNPSCTAVIAAMQNSVSKCHMRGKPLSPVNPPSQSAETAKRLERLGWRVIWSQVENTTRTAKGWW